MCALLAILREVRDPRDANARHDLAEVLFIALAATLCGAKSCVEIADFAEGREDELRESVRLRHGPPSHDTFSRVLRLLDPDELARAFAAFMTALRQGLGLPPPQGVVAVDAKALRRGYERGRAHLPPLMVSVWDAETRLPIAAARAPGRRAASVRYVALSRVVSPSRLAEIVRAHWSIENQLHWTLDVVFHEDDARTRKDNAPQNLAVIRRLAHNILSAHPLDKPIAGKMRKARWNKPFFFELFAHMR